MVDPDPAAVTVSTIADWFSIVGLPLALLGLGLGIWQIKQARAAAQGAKEAAEAASAAAQAATTRLLLVDSVVTLSDLIKDLASLQDAHRNSRWQESAERCQEIRNSLSEIREANSSLQTKDRRSLQEAVAQFRSIGEEVEIHLANGPVPDSARLNSVIADQSTKLTQLRIRLKLKDTNHV